MIDRYLKFIDECSSIVPTGFSVGLLIVFCLGAISPWVVADFKKGIKWSVGLMLLAYLLWLVSLTVLFRPILEVRRFDFIPFWSYRAVEAGNGLLLTQIIMNVVAFIPFGFLLGFSSRKMKWCKVVLIIAGFSLLIETLQFFTRRGFAEFDDVFHNVVGAMIGYGMFVGLRWLIKRVRRERVVGA